MEQVMTNTAPKRIPWIDVAKGVGILIVVLSHLLNAEQGLRYLIFAFHMPFFFFFSGVVFTGKGAFKDFLIKKIRTIYVPYAVFLLVDYLMIMVVRYMQGQLSFRRAGIGYVKGLLGMNIKDLINQPLWFLSAIFFLEIIAYFVVRLNKICIYAAIIVGILGAWLLNRNLIFSLSYVFHAIPFFFAGYLMKPFLNEENILKNLKLLVAGAMSGLIFLWFSALYSGPVDIQWFMHGKLPLYFINSFIGIFIFSVFSYLVRRSTMLNWFGQNTLVILCLHYPVTRVVLPFIIRKIGLGAYLYSLWMECALTVVTMAIMAVAIFICNHYFYFIFGKKKISNKKTVKA